ncbi:MAG: LTA synthase family protein [Syntrophales bacterium]|nr:LTA synthase family protein [Syntrophales bacterium]
MSRQVIILASLAFIIINSIKVCAVYSLLNIHSHQIFNFVTTAMLALIFYLTASRFKKPYILVTMYIIQCSYLEINLAYFIYYGDYVHFGNYLYLLPEIMEVLVEGVVPLNIKMSIPLLDLPLLLFLVISYPRLRNLSIAENVHPLRNFSLVILFVALTYLGLILFSDRLISPITNVFMRDHFIVEKYGLLAHNILDIWRFSTEEKDATDKIAYAKRSSLSNKSSKHFNIITIQVESLDASIIEHKYKGEYVAPFLNELSKNSVYYPYTLSYHGSGGTSDCEISVLNSIEPPHKYPIITSMHYDYPNSFIKILSQASYGTFAFHGNKGQFYNRSSAYRHMGFDKFFDIAQMGLREYGWGASDRDVFLYTLHKLRSEKEPFFYHIITMSSHEPFTNVKHYFHDDRYDDIDHALIRNYFNSISYVDKALGEFVSEARKISKDTYFFIYGDHTPPLVTDGPLHYVATVSNGRKYEFVPLFIITPKGRVYREAGKAACFLDIAPTILSLSGFPITYRTEGVNLLEYPIPDSSIPYQGNSYKRDFLYSMINNKKR